MGSRLLCCVVLCLLGAGPLDTAVFQTPKYLIARVGNKKSLRCEQKLGHDTMYWYKQDSEQLLKVMFAYNNKELFLNETVPSRFLPESPNKANLKLHIKSLELGDSAMYLCASSQHSPAKSSPPSTQTHRPSQETVGTKGSQNPRLPSPVCETFDGVSSIAQLLLPNRVFYSSCTQNSYRFQPPATVAFSNKFTEVLRTPQT